MSCYYFVILFFVLDLPMASCTWLLFQLESPLHQFTLNHKLPDTKSVFDLNAVSAFGLRKKRKNRLTAIFRPVLVATLLNFNQFPKYAGHAAL